MPEKVKSHVGDTFLLISRISLVMAPWAHWQRPYAHRRANESVLSEARRDADPNEFRIELGAWEVRSEIRNACRKSQLDSDWK